MYLYSFIRNQSALLSVYEEEKKTTLGFSLTFAEHPRTNEVAKRLILDQELAWN